jgi:hypothetical protein
MSRHADWSVCVCLVGVGQEINSGEEGIAGWGDALRNMTPAQRREWTIFAPEPVLTAGRSNSSLGILPEDLDCKTDRDLELRVSQRTYRSPSVSEWVDRVLAGDSNEAHDYAQTMGQYPVVLTRSLLTVKKWLRENGRGERRYGLVASSGARRLRAEGLGVSLHATSGDEIAHWYLNPPSDIRSSYALEVTANEYTVRGWNWITSAFAGMGRSSGTSKQANGRINGFLATVGNVLWITTGGSSLRIPIACC